MCAGAERCTHHRDTTPRGSSSWGAGVSWDDRRRHRIASGGASEFGLCATSGWSRVEHRGADLPRHRLVPAPREQAPPKLLTPDALRTHVRITTGQNAPTIGGVAGVLERHT